MDLIATTFTRLQGLINHAFFGKRSVVQTRGLFRLAPSRVEEIPSLSGDWPRIEEPVLRRII